MTGQKRFHPRRTSPRGGYAILVLCMMTLLVLGTLMPVLIKNINNEARASTHHKKNELALRMAEAGISQGYWKLVERDEHWDDLITQGPGPLGAAWLNPGYNFDVTFEHESGGSYRIEISSDSVGPNPADKRVIIEAAGMAGSEASGKVFRTIRTVYKPS